MKAFRAIWPLLVLAACAVPPAGIPDMVERTAERYITAWQKSDWPTVYRMEGRQPGQRPIMHDALTDSLAFYTINEVRYSDSAAACAVTLHWIIMGRTATEAGELYLTRQGTEWRITGFKSF